MLSKIHPLIYISLTKSRERIIDLGSTGGPMVDMTTKIGMVMNQHRFPERLNRHCCFRTWLVEDAGISEVGLTLPMDPDA